MNDMILLCAFLPSILGALLDLWNFRAASTSDLLRVVGVVSLLETPEELQDLDLLWDLAYPVITFQRSPIPV